MNPYINYYNSQVGSGLAGFQGIRYQKGHGWFGRLFTSVLPFIKQVLPALGKRALPSGIALAQDIFQGENVGKSVKTRLKEAGRNVADESLDILKSKLQKGSGRKRKRRNNLTKKLRNVKKLQKTIKKNTKKKIKHKKREKFLQ